jgi:hypothetical protein
MKNLILRSVVTMSLSQGVLAAGELSPENQRLEDFRRNINSIIECSKEHKNNILDHVELAKKEIETLAGSLKEDFAQILEDANFESFEDSVEEELSRAKTELNSILPIVKNKVDAAVDHLEEQTKQLADRLGISPEDQRKAKEDIKAATADVKSFLGNFL